MNLFENIISGSLGNKAFDYFRGTNPEDPTTSGLYQTIQGAANLYTGVAEEAKTGGQMEFEQKKEKARQFLSTKGYAPEVIESTLSQIEYKPSFLGRVREGLGTRMQEAGQTTERIAQQGITPKSLITAPVSYAGDVTATAFQPLVSAIEPYATPLVQKGIKATGQEQNMQKLSEEYAKLKQTSPNLADFLEGTLNVSQVLPSVFVKPVSQTVAQGGKAFVKTVENVAPKMVQGTKNIAIKTPQAIGKGVTTGAEYTTSLATGLSREAQQTIKSTPKLYKEARLGNITAQGELENFVKATEARLTDLSELGTGYDAIKKGNKIATIDDITNAYVKATEGVRDTTLTKADKLVLKDANDYMSQMKGDLDETDILGLRRQLDSIMYDPNTGLKRKVSPNGERVVQTMRAEIDRIAKERIPGLAELDAKYGPEVGLLKDVKKQIYDANGNIKPTALSTISNIVGKNKDFKLEQFQKIYPELGARIKALKAFEEVQALGEIKTGSVIRQGGAIAAGSAVAPGVGTVLAWMATNPYIAARVLELYGVAKSKISEMLKKGTKVSPKDAEIVVKAVQNTPKEKMADIINNLSFDPKTNRLTSGNIGPKKLNTMGKMEAAKVPKSIVAQENGIRRPYTLNGNKPIVKRASDVGIGTIESSKNIGAKIIISDGLSIYHGTSKSNAQSIKSKGLQILPEGRNNLTGEGSYGVSFSVDKNIGKKYSDVHGGEVIEMNIPKGTKILQIDSKGNGIDETFTYNELENLSKKYDAILDISEGQEKEIRVLKDLPRPKQISKGPSMSKEDEALMSEARKYKSAEEFVETKSPREDVEFNKLPDTVKEDIASDILDSSSPEHNFSVRFGVEDIMSALNEQKVSQGRENIDFLLSQFKLQKRGTSEKAVKNLVDILRKEGELDPIIVNGRELIDGGHRIMAYKELGKKEIPVIDIRNIYKILNKNPEIILDPFEYGLKSYNKPKTQLTDLYNQVHSKGIPRKITK